MNLFFLIFGILWNILFPIQRTTDIAIEEAPSNSFFISMQQDSTPPKGTVKIKELGSPKKKKKVSKAKKAKSQQVVIKDSKRTKSRTAKQSSPKVKKKPAAKTKQESTVDVEQDPSPKLTAKTDSNKTPPLRKKQQGKGLSAEEEIKLLAKAKVIKAKDKIHPESAKNCRFAFDVIDEFTGVQKRGLEARSFFAYTPDEYRKFIKKDDFIRCEGFLSQSSEGGMALNINLYVASREAKQKFGAIKANSALVLRTMEGKEYYLMTYPGAEPQVVDNSTYYQCSFAIDKSDLKHLQKAEIDQVKISFQKGFQSYDVFYLDFLMDQFPCFED